MTTALHYRIECVNPGAHLFLVKLTIKTPDPKGCRLSLPAWIPGSYMIREFARNIVQINAHCSRRPVVLEKIDKHTWLAAPCVGPLIVEYEVYAWDLSVRAAHLDQTHGFFNGTSVFLSVSGHENNAHAIDIVRPSGRDYAKWRVATSLRRAPGTPPNGFGEYQARNYDELIDHPVEIGTFSLVRYSACGVPHAIAITGRHDCDLARLAADLKRLCEVQIRFFHGPRATRRDVPFGEYIFLVLAVGDGYGGLEHRSSTALICSREDLP
ncbi:MAG: M61 family peptidase, partial [Hyphomicrobium sp.]